MLASPVFASAAILTGQLDFGMTSSDVGSLQTFLAADPSIYPEGLVTNYFGSLTMAATKRYQSAHGITPVGRVGPITLASINGSWGTGGSDDVYQAVTKDTNVTTDSNSATITWTSNEKVYGRVMYGNHWPFLYASAPSVSSQSGFNTFQSVKITGLQSHTMYYYVIESSDIAGNITWTVGKALMTE
jgi:peptidoglycan hydrolase-like protein with peptidoglycan-binding domain